MKTLTILFLSILILSCKDENNNASTSNNQTNIEEQNEVAFSPTQNGTYLCKINSKNWYYTEASGIVSKRHDASFRIATITFKKKLDKGNEAIQLEYNVDENKVIRVLANLKPNDKSGNRISANYTTREGYLEPGESISGNIDLSNTETAPGTATFTVANDYQKSKLKTEDQIIRITDLNFSGVAYSDINKVFGQ